MTEKQIFDYLVKNGLTELGAAGLMGNLVAESGLRSNNLQNSYEKSLGMDDETYTAAVDIGAYQNFVRDSAGYGLAQWTYWSRKQNLLAFAKQQGKSIGDYQMQLDFLMKELREGYGSVLAILKSASSIRMASDAVLLQYERPADQSQAVQQQRASLGQQVYDRCKGSVIAPTPTPVDKRTISALATNRVEFGTINSNARKNPVSKITIHHMVGVMTSVACATMHLSNPAKEQSANYYIGNDGDICSGVREDRRAWTSGTGDNINTNDHMAITIEVSNSVYGDEYGWPISEKAYKSLIALCADICKRYNIDPHFDGTPNGTLTAHYMFQPTVCPGPYVKELLQSGKIEADIKSAMGKSATNTSQNPTPSPDQNKQVRYRVMVGEFDKKTDADALAAELQAKQVSCFVTKDKGSFTVQVGSFAGRGNANRRRDELKRDGYEDTHISEALL